MVRNRSWQSGRPPSSPHARGDGPRRSLLGQSDRGFSPRPWGWSAEARWRAHPGEVLPTPVGMVREPAPFDQDGRGSPHARGDGPSSGSLTKQPRTFSPRPWGWSVFLELGLRGGDVLPTPVGMVRLIRVEELPMPCSPHARGDGPDRCRQHAIVVGFSPRPWGWSAVRTFYICNQSVLPTPVGMVRSQCVSMPSRPSSPHARGDGPNYDISDISESSYSPRPPTHKIHHHESKILLGQWLASALRSWKKVMKAHSRGELKWSLSCF
jgi:hypothetical protein